MTVHRLEVPWFHQGEPDSIGVIVIQFQARFWERLQAIACYLSRIGLNCVPVSTGPTSADRGLKNSSAAYR